MTTDQTTDETAALIDTLGQQATPDSITPPAIAAILRQLNLAILQNTANIAAHRTQLAKLKYHIDNSDRSEQMLDEYISGDLFETVNARIDRNAAALEKIKPLIDNADRAAAMLGDYISGKIAINDSVQQYVDDSCHTITDALNELRAQYETLAAKVDSLLKNKQ